MEVVFGVTGEDYDLVVSREGDEADGAVRHFVIFLLVLSLEYSDLLLLLFNVLLGDVLTLLSLDGNLLSEVIDLLL